MYREFDIGTAKPSAGELASAPHHLFDCVDPTQYVTAGEYARQARQVLGEIKLRRHLPIVVGGTGLYLRALLEGLFPGPQRSEELRERVRERAAQRGSPYLYAILKRLDRAAADKIHPNDAPKLIRAIEVCLTSRSDGARQKMSELWQQGRDPLRGFRILRFGLDPERGALYDRINQRARQMFEAGLIEETAASAREIRFSRTATGVSRIQAGSAAFARRTQPRAGPASGAAGASQLCQAADDVVPARAGGGVAEGISAGTRRFSSRLLGGWRRYD